MSSVKSMTWPIPILRTMIKPKSNRIAILEKQIKWIEEHYQYRHRHDNTSNNNDDGVFIKQLKQDDTHSN